MKTYADVRIGDVADVKGGKRLPKGASVQDEPTAYPYLRVVDFGENGINRSNIKFIEERVQQQISRYKIVEQDIYISIAGTIGRVGTVPADLSGANLTENAAKITAISERIDKRYLMYFLRAPTGQSAIRNQTGGTSQPKLALYRIEEIRFPCPSLPTQRAIADILSAYDDLIENNRRRIALLEEAARLLYREWFVHFRFPGHEHVRIVEGLPKGWVRRYLGEVVTTQYGHTASASDEEVGPKFVRGTDINKRSFIDWSTVPYCPEQGLDFNKYALVPGDILVIRMADPGKVAFVEKSIRAVFASYLVRLKIRNTDELPPIYLFMTLMEERYQGFIGSSSGGSTRKSASAKLLTDFHFAQPPKVLLKLFIEQVAPMREMITNLVDQSAGAAQARDLVLPRLMNGEIAV